MGRDDITKIFSDKQMWKLEGSELINKANMWISSDNWKLPSKLKNGYIENSSKKSSDGKIVILKAGEIKVSEFQKAGPTNSTEPMDLSLQWQKIETERSDYFTLQNMKSGKYLTATSSGNLMIDGDQLIPKIERLQLFCGQTTEFTSARGIFFSLSHKAKG